MTWTRPNPSSHNPTNFGYGNYGVQGLNPIREKEKNLRHTEKRIYKTQIRVQHGDVGRVEGDAGARKGRGSWSGVLSPDYRSLEPFCVDWCVFEAPSGNVD